jgi:hypothetical protein
LGSISAVKFRLPHEAGCRWRGAKGHGIPTPALLPAAIKPKVADVRKVGVSADRQLKGLTAIPVVQLGMGNTKWLGLMVVDPRLWHWCYELRLWSLPMWLLLLLLLVLLRFILWLLMLWLDVIRSSH